MVEKEPESSLVFYDVFTMCVKDGEHHEGRRQGSVWEERMRQVQVKCGLGEPDGPPSAACRQGLDVEIQLELVGMWPQAHGIDFLAAFILQPGLDDILGEHIAFGEKLVIALQSGERPVE